MKLKPQAKTKKKLNLFSLFSLITLPILIIVLAIPWYRLFLLRDDVLSTLFIRVTSMAIAGLLMIILGLLGVFKAKKKERTYLGTWMGIVGIIIGLISFGISAFVIIDYLVTMG